MRAQSTTGHAPAIASSGLANAERPYPPRTNGLRFPQRSEMAPKSHLKMLAVASAKPSMTPTTEAGAPRVPERNNGTSGYTISLEMSFRRLTTESNRTFREMPRIGDGSHAVSDRSVMGPPGAPSLAGFPSVTIDCVSNSAMLESLHQLSPGRAETTVRVVWNRSAAV